MNILRKISDKITKKNKSSTSLVKKSVLWSVLSILLGNSNVVMADNPNELSEKLNEPTAKEYVVQKWDTLFGIAKKFNITNEDIITFNPQKKDNINDLIIWEKINLVRKEQFHLVQKWDTLYGIAKQYNISQDDIVSFNTQKKDINDLSIWEIIHLSEASQNASQKNNAEKQVSTKIQKLWNQITQMEADGLTGDPELVVLEKEHSKLVALEQEKENTTQKWVKVVLEKEKPITFQDITKLTGVNQYTLNADIDAEINPLTLVGKDILMIKVENPGKKAVYLHRKDGKSEFKVLKKAEMNIDFPTMDSQTVLSLYDKKALDTKSYMSPENQYKSLSSDKRFEVYGKNTDQNGFTPFEFPNKQVEKISKLEQITPEWFQYITLKSRKTGKEYDLQRDAKTGMFTFADSKFQWKRALVFNGTAVKQISKADFEKRNNILPDGESPVFYAIKAFQNKDTLGALHCTDWVDRIYKKSFWKSVYDSKTIFDGVTRIKTWTGIGAKKYAKGSDINQIKPGDHIMVDRPNNGKYWVWKTHSVMALQKPVNGLVKVASLSTWNEPPLIETYDLLGKGRWEKNGKPIRIQWLDTISSNQSTLVASLDTETIKKTEETKVAMVIDKNKMDEASRLAAVTPSTSDNVVSLSQKMKDKISDTISQNDTQENVQVAFNTVEKESTPKQVKAKKVVEVDTSFKFSRMKKDATPIEKWELVALLTNVASLTNNGKISPDTFEKLNRGINENPWVIEDTLVHQQQLLKKNPSDMHLRRNVKWLQKVMNTISRHKHEVRIAAA